ncbi:MAG TPA: hypothetical protein VK281_03235 [Xanthobacteraceae bacterium]|nr:hypothetical protein [Xanthobacteraceae bacterium]
MRGIGFIATILSVLLASSAAWPQAKTVRYFELSGEILGDLPVDAFLREERQGAKVVAAALDVCYSVSLASPRKDRFVVNLKPDADRLVGSGQSQEDKVAVTVRLIRKRSGETTSFTGVIQRGQEKSDVSSTDNTDIDEKEFLEGRAVDDPIVATPADFTELSPGSIAVRVKRESLGGLVKELKTQNLMVEFESLVPDCVALRSGEQVVHADVDPERAPAVIARLKALPGVAAAGWIGGSYSIANAVRLPAAAWKGGDGKLDRGKLASAVATSVATSLSATLDSTAWDETTGELTMTFKRPNQRVPQLALTDVVELTALAGPEKPGATDALVVWLSAPTLTTVDEGPEPRLKFIDVEAGDDEGQGANNDELVAAVARDLKGKQWDSDQSAWK